MKPKPARRARCNDAFQDELRASEDLWVAPLLSFRSLLRESGVEERAVFKRAGIDPQSFDDPWNRLPFTMVGRFAQECVTATGCPHFGLLVGQRSGMPAAGIAGELARHSETVRDGLRALITHLHLHDRGAVLALHEGRTHAELAYVIHRPGMTGADQILDAALAIGFAILRGLCGPQWLPSAVTLSRERPASLAPYRACFRAPILFDAARSALVFPVNCLDQPIAGADASERARLSDLVADLAATRPATVREKVVRALNQIVVAASPSSSRVARVVGLSERTMSRRLEAEGTTFRQLLEQVRLERACQLLEQSRMPVGEIAAALHYSAPAAFSRAFKAWTGERPLRRRKRAARPAGPLTREPARGPVSAARALPPVRSGSG